MNSMRLTIAGIIVILNFFGAISTANADIVEIQTLDSSIRLKGELLDFDGTYLSIETALGVIQVRAGGVTCTGDACPSTNTQFTSFTMSGSRVLADTLMPGLLEVYAENRQAINTLIADSDALSSFQLQSDTAGTGEVRIVSADTESGFADLRNGTAVLALAARSADKLEIDSFEADRLGNLKSIEQENVLALNALVLVTHPNNPVHSISEENAARVFSGQIVNWKDLGGADSPIVLHGRSGGTGTNELFNDLVMAGSGQLISTAINTHDTDEAVVDAVLLEQGGIGFASFAKLGDARALDIEEVCGLRTPATPFTIKSEEYPYSQILYAYRANTEFEPGVRDFIDFIISDIGQNAVNTIGFVDQNVTSEPVNGQGYRLATAMATSESVRDLNVLKNLMISLQTAERLSTTFRFNTGSSKLNARAEADIQRLVAYLENTNMTGKEVVFVGFTDSIGTSELNEFLSLNRAELVMQSVLAASPNLASIVNIRAEGFGEIAPVGCNESNRGRTINRRVEVWVRDVPS